MRCALSDFVEPSMIQKSPWSSVIEERAMDIEHAVFKCRSPAVAGKIKIQRFRKNHEKKQKTTEEGSMCAFRWFLCQ